jgi:stage V sporulation protein D (sporulation-specific penicillin-binding protein)
MFSTMIHKRIKIVFLVVVFCFIVIIAKVFYIQVIEYDKLNELANNLWSRNLPIGADRGLITTVDGKVIANNLTTVSLVFIPSQIDDDKKEEISNAIASILDCDVSAIEEHIYKNSSIERVHPEGRNLSYDEADQIDALGYDGVYLVKESKRNYPYNMLLCHALGYVGIDNQGLSGLELQYDDYLTGATGSIQYYSDAKGNKLTLAENYVEPTDGMNIELTVNYEIQSSIERELDNAMEKYNADGAWAIAMDPNSGEILGIASRPGFDPNNYQDYSTEEINRNLAIWASYEPGSTFNIVTSESDTYVLILF